MKLVVSGILTHPWDVEGRTGWLPSYSSLEPSSPPPLITEPGGPEPPLLAMPGQGDQVCPLGKAEHLGWQGQQPAQGHTANWWGRHLPAGHRQAGGGPALSPVSPFTWSRQ